MYNSKFSLGREGRGGGGGWVEGVFKPTWRRTVEKEMKQMENTSSDIQGLADVEGLRCLRASHAPTGNGHE